MTIAELLKQVYMSGYRGGYSAMTDEELDGMADKRVSMAADDIREVIERAAERAMTRIKGGSETSAEAVAAVMGLNTFEKELLRELGLIDNQTPEVHDRDDHQNP